MKRRKQAGGDASVGNFMIDRVCEKAIAGLLRGEADALSAIYDSIGRQVYDRAYSILQNHHDAEDVLQQTLIELVRCAHTYRKGAGARAWILGIARNQSRKLARDRRDVPCGDAGTDVREFDTLLTMEEALATLGEEERRIVILRVFSDMKYKEIASELQITAASAEKKYQRAIQKLRRYYTD